MTKKNDAPVFRNAVFIFSIVKGPTLFGFIFLSLGSFFSRFFVGALSLFFVNRFGGFSILGFLEYFLGRDLILCGLFFIKADNGFTGFSLNSGFIGGTGDIGSNGDA